MFLMFTTDESYLTVFKTTYTLTLGELDFVELNTTRFFIFVVYTTLITLVLMNLLIAILGDAYELVQSEKKYYDGKAILSRSLMYERLVMLFLELFKGKKKQEYNYLFISMPLNYEDDANVEDEGMIGKVLNDARKNQKETITKMDDNEKKMKKEINEKIDTIEKKINEKIDENQKKVEANQDKMGKRIDDLSEKVDKKLTET